MVGSSTDRYFMDGWDGVFMMDIDLKPCPFCGGAVTMETGQKRDEFYGARTWYGIICRNTINRGGSCAVSISPSASAEAAADRWNMRGGKL